MAMLYVALGANVGPRELTLRQAIRALDERIGPLVRCSAFHETVPVGFQSDALFLNAAASFQTEWDAKNLLRITQEVERELGRTRKSLNGHYADRTIDIDLLMLDDICMQTPELTLPHPHMHERDFVLTPLAEIAPLKVHPRLQLTMKDLLLRLKDPS